MTESGMKTSRSQPVPDDAARRSGDAEPPAWYG